MLLDKVGHSLIVSDPKSGLGNLPVGYFDGTKVLSLKPQWGPENNGWLPCFNWSVVGVYLRNSGIQAHVLRVLLVLLRLSPRQASSPCSVGAEDGSVLAETILGKAIDVVRSVPIA